MAFDSLSEKLQNVFKNLRSKGKLTEDDVKAALKEVKMALLEADVNFKVVKQFTKSVQERAIGQDVMNGLNPGQMVIKIVNEEMIKLMGSETTEIAFRPGKELTVIMMVGLQGAGKTTTTAKIAGKLKSKGKKSLLVACDVYRPAAIEQLKINGEKQGVEVFSMGDKNKPADIAKAAVEHAKKNDFNVVIIDTAGRLHIDEDMMAELIEIKEATDVFQTILVVDAMTGQDAVNVAGTFDEKIGIDGVVITKLDGDTRGGAALSIRAVTGKPILYAGMGEKLSDLEQFYPERMASRILGMGDVLSMIEKAQENIDEEQAKKLEQKMRKNEFDFEMYLDSMSQMKKMGGLSSVMGMMPGMGIGGGKIQRRKWVRNMRKVALITDGWRRLFTYAWPAGILQRIKERDEEVNLYIFNSTGNWSRDAGYNRAEYNIFNLPDLSEFDGIILELNNISSPAVLAEVIHKAKQSHLPVVSIANELEDFYYVGIDNYSAMKQVIAHMHEVHNCKKFWLLVGADSNYESSCRLQGMLDYAKEHKIKIDKNDIWYGSFDYKSGLEGYRHLWDTHKELPDAIICINDNVAVAVCEAAAQMGFTAPKDFRITGFDNFDKAGFYTPSITTVGHIREEAAYKGMDILLKIWAGESVPRYNFTNTEMLWQESCGCGKGSSRDARAHLKDQIMYSVESEEFDEEVLSMEAEMMQCNTVEEMMYCIPQCIPSLKCDAMYLVLDDHLNAYKKETEKSIHLDATPSDEGFSLHGYPRQMQMTFAYERDQRLDLDRQEVDGIFPTFDYPKPGQDFLFLPLHFGERTVGYVAIRNAVYLMEKQYLFQIMNALTRSMENLHKKEMLAYMNRKLSSLYIMDTLTGMYNRMGYQQLGEESFRISGLNKRKLLILFVDLDRLKYINDTFGHEYGDMAICAAARALMQCSSRDAVPARTGGDEFVLIQSYQSDEVSRELVLRIRRTLEAEGKAQKLPFPLSMSIGTVVTDPESALSFADYVKIADSRMYEEKVQKRAARK